MKNPLVTIVTVTYNLIESGRKDYFKQCLESVHNQTYANVEHIVIDGGSKDGSVDLIKKYANKGWIKYISEQDNGIYDAMNKGIEMANGKYVAFLNSDDYYHEKYGIARVIETLEKSGADFSYSPIRLLDNEGNGVQKEHLSRKPDIKRAFLKIPFCHQTMFSRRDMMVKENMFNTEFEIAGDYDFLVRICLQNYKSVFIDYEFASYTVGGMSAKMNVENHEEVAEIYFKEFNKLCSISKKVCEEIVKYEYKAIPVELARKLKEKNDYFNFEEYIRENSIDFDNDYRAEKNLKLSLKNKQIFKELYDGHIYKIHKYNHKKNDVKVSIVIVAYNEGKDLLRNLNSIKKQSFHNFEVIVVDNGLDDGIKDVLKKYSLIHIVLNKNSGPSAGRNIGACYAVADLLAFVDADGYVNECYIESVMEIMKDTSKIAVRGKILPIRCSIEIPPIHYDYGNQQVVSSINVEGNVVIRKKDYIKVGGQEESLFGHEGVVLFYRMMKFYNYKVESFHYDPRLVLHHDFEKKNVEINAKKDKRHDIIYDMIKDRYPDFKEFVNDNLSINDKLKHYEKTKKLKNAIRIMQMSKTFRLGDLFFRSVKKPYKLITYPYNFIKILLEK